MWPFVWSFSEKLCQDIRSMIFGSICPYQDCKFRGMSPTAAKRAVSGGKSSYLVRSKHVGQTLRFRDLGDFGDWVLNADMLRAAITRICCGNDCFRTHTELKLAEHGPQANLNYRVTAPLGHGRSHASCTSLARLLDLLREFLVSDLSPRRIIIDDGSFVTSAEFEQFFGLQYYCTGSDKLHSV